MATAIQRSLRICVVAVWKPFVKSANRVISRKTTLQKSKTFLHRLLVPVSLILPVMAASDDKKQMIEESEVLFENKEFEQLYNMLIAHKDSQDANILWRLARACTEKGKMGEADERKRAIYEAWEYIKKAMELDDQNFAIHKWYGILLDYTGEYEGNKQRILNAFEVKEHFQKAIELNPKDATTRHCLGVWCFMFADMPWYQRKAAAVIFASPPTSTYDEALEHFKNAEEMDPGFYNPNKLMLGKTYMRLKDKEAAKTVLLKAYEHKDMTADDIKARKEVQDLLKELGVKV